MPLSGLSYINKGFVCLAVVIQFTIITTDSGKPFYTLD